MASQVQLASLKAAVETATAQGIKYGEMVKVGGWELRFELPRKAGELPALIHALHK